MKIENLEEFNKKVRIINDKISEYYDEEKGVKYILPTPHAIARVDYLELDSAELKKAIFEQKVEDLNYNWATVDRPKSKYSITKKEEDKFTIVNSQVKVYQIWNVSNGLGYKKSFTSKEEAIKLYEKTNKIIADMIK